MNPIAQLRQTSIHAQDPFIDAEEDGNCVLVRDPAEMAPALSSASRTQARPFAIAMHERACFEDNEHKRDFWSLVLQHLADEVAVLRSMPAGCATPLASPEAVLRDVEEHDVVSEVQIVEAEAAARQAVRAQHSAP